MRVFALSVALLFGSFGGTADASLATLDEGLNTVRSVAGSVVELPGGSSPPLPENPVVGPKAPAGAVSREPAQEPAPQPTAPRSVEPSATSDPAASVPSPGTLAGAPGADALPGAAAGQGKEAAPPDPVEDEARPSRRARAGAGAGSRGSVPGSIRAAMPAPLEEWLAHLWPAVSLGPIGNALTTQAAAVLAPSLLLASLAVAGQPSLAPNSAPPGAGPTAARTAQTASPDSHPFFSPNSGGMSFLVTVITVLAALCGLVALARLTVGEDFFSTRWLR